jgi:hypothetical protein
MIQYNQDLRKLAGQSLPEEYLQLHFAAQASTSVLVKESEAYRNL